MNCILTSVLTVEIQPFGHANAPFLFGSVLTDAYVGKIVKREIEENSNSKTLMLKNISVRSIWTYLTASLC